MAGERPSAIQLFAVEHPFGPRTMRAKLEVRRADLVSQLVSSVDWPDFKQRLGVIRGLEEAIAACADFEKHMES